jgi:hypothetical protein
MEESKEIESRTAIRFKRFRFVQEKSEDSGLKADRNGFILSGSVPASQRPQRLSDKDRRRLNDLLWPILKLYPEPAWPEPWSLYLLPLPAQQARSVKPLLNFIGTLIETMPDSKSLNHYTFIDQQCLYPNLVTVFALRAAAFMAIIGVGVRPEFGPPRFPSQKDVEGLDQKRVVAILQEKQQKMSAQDLFPDMPAAVYWIKQNQPMARELLFGEGGWSFIMSPLGEKPFFETTKALLLEGSEDEAMSAMPSVIPLFGLNSFLHETPRKLHKWFELIDLYLGECPQENGLVIASRSSLDDLIIKLVQQLELQEERNLW